MKIKSSLLLIILCLGCSQEDQSNSLETKTTSNKSDDHKIVGDSSQSSVKLNTVDSLGFFNKIQIENIYYSIEHINYQNDYQKLICKNHVNFKDDSSGPNTLRYEKKEFFDLNMNKLFSISANHRKIELRDDYFVTWGVLVGSPKIFELNNYQTNEPFIKCTGYCRTVEIPSRDTVAYFGNQGNINNPEPNLEPIGTLYYGINETKVEEIQFYHQQEERKFQRFFSIKIIADSVKGKIKPNSPQIIRTTLGLKDDSKGSGLNGFELQLSFMKTSPSEESNYEKVVHRIKVENGKLIHPNIINKNGKKIFIVE